MLQFSTIRGSRINDNLSTFFRVF